MPDGSKHYPQEAIPVAAQQKPGHLVVHDGIADRRNVRRFHRATGQLKRLVVIGHAGFVTLDALGWISDVGAVFVQIDGDSSLIAATAGKSVSSERRLRRAQVLAAESSVGIGLLVGLLTRRFNAKPEPFQLFSSTGSQGQVPIGVARAAARSCSHARPAVDSGF